MWMRYTARTLALLWGAFWAWFCVASAIGEKSGSLGGWMHIIPGLIFLFTALIAWKWEKPGGALMIAEGLLASVFFHVWEPKGIFLVLVLVLPAIAAGVLFLLSGRKPVPHASGQEG